MTGIVPTNAYPCRPSPTSPTSPAYVVIGANADSLYARLMHAIGRPDLVGPAYAHNHHRVARQAEIEGAIAAWTRARTAVEAEDALRAVLRLRAPHVHAHRRQTEDSRLWGARDDRLQPLRARQLLILGHQRVVELADL